MSGHNPHGHLTQPNSSWNPLQIPSYIPRQPQVAHMSSNERSLVRSPLTWHTPTPPEALYSFISAKHKNLELNPLLPSFVRGPPPTFSGSVDLTIQSSRNNSATSPRNLASPSPDFTTMHSKQMTHNVITNNLQSSGANLGPGVIQTTGSVRDKFSTSNGSNCELPSSGGGGVGGLYIRDARQINNDLMKMTAAVRDPNEVSALINEQPVELVNQTAKLHAVPTSPRRLSPPRTSSILNHTSISPESTSPVPLSMNVGIGINLDIVNNHISSHPLQPQQMIAVSSTAAETITQFENSPLCSAAPSPLNAASNDDSVDSNASKTRRRRKPNRIIRVPNDSDDSLPANDKNNSKSYPKDVTDGGGGGIGGSNSTSDKNENCLKLNNDKFQTPLDVTGEANISNKIENNIVAVEQHHHHHHHHQHQRHNQQQQQTETERLEKERTGSRSNDGSNGGDGSDWTKSVPLPGVIDQEIENNKMKSVIVDNAAAAAVTSRTMNDLEHHRQHQHRRHDLLENRRNNTQIEISKSQPKGTDEDNDDEDEEEDTQEIATQGCCLNNNSNKRVHSKQKGDPDDIETIDKIAAMIASSNDNEEHAMEVDCGNNLTQREAQIEKNEESEQSGSKLTDLTEILGTPITTSTNINSDNNCISNNSLNHLPSQESSENVKEIRFEEVENKLEEMFAGIEDERPCNDTNASGTNDDQNDPALELEQPLQTDNKIESSSLVKERKHVNNVPIPSTSSSTSSLSSSSHKKSLTAKQQLDAPPKKKRKITSKKTAQSNQKVVRQQKSSKSSQNEKATKEKSVKDKQDECATSSSGGGGVSGVSGGGAGNSNDFKYKGPFVQLKADGSINIVNAPIAEDDTEKQNKVKKTLQNHHTNSERSKIRGLHVSTLSVKYDADTIDATWMCVFCKKGPHRNGLGDLFGPYIVTTTCEDFQLSQKNPSEDEFISKRTKAQMVQKSCNLPVVPATVAQQHQSANSGSTNPKKKKRGAGTVTDSSSNAQKVQSSTDLVSISSASAVDTKDIFFGMSRVSDTAYEIWTHEDCAVWASGVYMIGSRIIGLETAVWSSTRYKCSICSLNGAMICCLQRGCLSKAHVPCARYKNWQLIETDYKSYCEKHYYAATMDATTSVAVTSVVS